MCTSMSAVYIHAMCMCVHCIAVCYMCMCVLCLCVCVYIEGMIVSRCGLAGLPLSDAGPEPLSVHYRSSFSVPVLSSNPLPDCNLMPALI